MHYQAKYQRLIATTLYVAAILLSCFLGHPYIGSHYRASLNTNTHACTMQLSYNIREHISCLIPVSTDRKVHLPNMHPLACTITPHNWLRPAVHATNTFLCHMTPRVHKERVYMTKTVRALSSLIPTGEQT